ncbi:MAG: hypothetical protein RBU45_07565, partial [Myxococcota bacterium]|nr:hypothetical protein [Myxococcota bacterium]
MSRVLAAVIGVLLLTAATPGFAGEPTAYVASPGSLKDRSSWDISLQVSGEEVTATIKGTHPGFADCTQTPSLVVKTNEQKARVKTRQSEKIRCGSSEQTATFTTKRRAIELFINGDLVAFLDLQGAAGVASPVDEPLVLPVDPQPGEPVFVVVPAPAEKKGCHAVTKIKAAKKGKAGVSVTYQLAAAKKCEEKADRYQVLGSVGVLPKGKYALALPDAQAEFGVGEVVKKPGKGKGKGKVAKGEEEDEEDAAADEEKGKGKGKGKVAKGEEEDEEDAAADEEQGMGKGME